MKFITKIMVAMAIVWTLFGAALKAQDSQMLGEIKMFAGNYAPRGWALCEGQLLPIAQYSALFAILGTTYGGDGRTTFALPDLRGRVPVGVNDGSSRSTSGSSIYQGQSGGTESITLNADNLPNHMHSIPSAALDPKNPSQTLSAGKASVQTTGASPTGTINSSSVGNQQPIDNRQPFLGIRYIIALDGYFPARG